jgi:hypothetical protein
MILDTIWISSSLLKDFDIDSLFEIIQCLLVWNLFMVYTNAEAFFIS